MTWDDKQNFIEREKFNVRKYGRGVGQFFLVILKLLPFFLLAAVGVILVITIAGAIALGPYYSAIKSVYNSSLDGQNHLLSAENFIKDHKFQSASIELGASEKSFQEAGTNLKKIENSVIFQNAFLKDQLLVAEDIVSIGESVSGSLKDVSLLGQDFLDKLQLKNFNFTQITLDQKVSALSVLANSVDRLQKAQQTFVQAEAKLADITKHQPIFIFNQAVQPLQDNIPKLQKAFDGLIVAAKLLPEFSGYPKEKTYLLIFENNREMRPSGGFIGTYGIVKIKNAELTSFFTDNIYNFDRLSEPYLNIPSPAPLAKYMAQPKWFLRDANWWPDFPTSAEKVLSFYKLEQGKENLDGVISITPTVIEGLLSVLGEFTVDDMKFNKDNFWDQLEYQVEYGYNTKGIASANRKDIIGDLGQRILARLYLLPTNQWLSLIDVMGTEAKEKQILLYFKNASAQKVALQNNWAGEVKTATGDYLMLVDANLAALKTDSVMSRTLAYRLTEDKNNKLTAETKVTYQNLGTFTWKTTRYRTYTRLYVPQGSKLTSVTVGGQPADLKTVDITDEFGKTSFGLFFEVEPQTFKDVIWKYALPQPIEDKIVAGQYSLLVQKQPGIPQMNLQLDINLNRDITTNQGFDFSVGKRTVKQVKVLRNDELFTVGTK